MQSTTTLCRYWVKPEKEDELLKHLSKHEAVFRGLDLWSDDGEYRVWRGEDPDKGIFYVELFPWNDADAVKRAHSLPEVGAVWEPIGGCCTSMEFPHVEEVVF